MMLILGLIIWNAFGIIIFATSMCVAHGYEDGTTEVVLDELNPIWQYKTRKLNWFGAILLSMFWNLMCPIISIGYWLYKLCTVGRSK